MLGSSQCWRYLSLDRTPDVSHRFLERRSASPNARWARQWFPPPPRPSLTSIERGPSNPLRGLPRSTVRRLRRCPNHDGGRRSVPTHSDVLRIRLSTYTTHPPSAQSMPRSGSGHVAWPGLPGRADVHQVKGSVGGLAARLVDEVHFLGQKRRQHVRPHRLVPRCGLITREHGPAYADLDAAKLAGAERLDQRMHAVVPARAALHPDTHFSQRQVEVIEDDDEVG